MVSKLPIVLFTYDAWQFLFHFLSSTTTPTSTSSASDQVYTASHIYEYKLLYHPQRGHPLFSFRFEGLKKSCVSALPIIGLSLTHKEKQVSRESMMIHRVLVLHREEPICVLSHGVAWPDCSRQWISLVLD